MRAALLAALLAAPVTAAEGPWFEGVAEAWGLAFRHHHGGSGRRYMVETVVGGVVLFDYDGDGDHDVFFVDGGELPGYTGEPPGSRLYRNDGPGRFLDVTGRAGVAVAGYGAGGTAGDVDGDGDLDLYVTAFGVDQLFENAGDGTFEDATAAAGLG
ncbi:MAG: FG-GAP-like repeat-containing protein, partial [Thermoanaerobaculia bacterium]